MTRMPQWHSLSPPLSYSPPAHLVGAYSRALNSDAWRRRDIVNDLVRTRILAHNFSTQDRVKITFRIVPRDGCARLHVSHDAAPGDTGLPPRLTERVEDILTKPLDDMPATTLRQADLSAVWIPSRSVPAHEQIRLRARLAAAGLADHP